MAGGEILQENMKVGKLTMDDLTAKLREANVIDWSEIKAVVLESTGDSFSERRHLQQASPHLVVTRLAV